MFIGTFIKMSKNYFLYSDIIYANVLVAHQYKS